MRLSDHVEYINMCDALIKSLDSTHLYVFSKLQNLMAERLEAWRIQCNLWKERGDEVTNLLIGLGHHYEKGELVFVEIPQEATLFERQERIWPKFQEWWEKNKC